MSISIRSMTIHDYPVVLSLWQRTEGIGLSQSDTKDAIGVFLKRNPGASAVATLNSGEVVGAVLCGHDGRRGYLHHLAVEAKFRRQGVASLLLRWCFGHLAAEKIDKCNVFLFGGNDAAIAFWKRKGWGSRDDMRVFQKMVR
jgi:putative acetyltransferase